MGTREWWKYGRQGLATLSASILFFYRHSWLLILALVPSTIRAFQMWHEMRTPAILEAIVEAVRILLFCCMISFMVKVPLGQLFQKHVWETIGTACSLHLKNSWPNRFLAEIAIFVLFLYGLGNGLLAAIAHLAQPVVLNLLDIPETEQAAKAVYNACLYFLKNMSVIPLTPVYMLFMLGIKRTSS